MATYKRGQGFRTEFVISGVRYRHTSDTEAEGQAWEAYTRLQVARGDAPSMVAPTPSSTPKGATLGELCVIAEALWKGTDNEQSATTNAREVVAFFGKGKLVESLTHDDLDALNKHLKSRVNLKTGKGQLSPATINRKLAALSRMLNIAQERGFAVRIKIKTSREAEGRQRYLSPEEERDILEQLFKLSGKDIHDFVQFSIETGGRLSETLSLHTRDVTTLGGVNYLTFRGVTTKSHKSRTIPLTKKAWEMIEGRLSGGPIWPKDLARWHIDRAWAAAKKAAGIRDKDLVFHCCRHTFATRLLEGTGDLVVVQKSLGHSKIDTTSRYTKVTANSLVKAFNTLEQRREAFLGE